MADPLKVILLPVDPATGRHLFYAEPPADPPGGEPPAPEGAPGGGLRARISARLRRLKEGWRHSEGRGVKLARSVWDWLQRRAHPDESLLARLRSAPEVELHHPASLSPDEAAAAWSAFLDRSRRRHGPWFVVNLLVAPAAALLAILPGPNLVGYWFAYRALRDGLILHGLHKARSDRIPTRLRPSPALDAGSPHDPARLEALGCDPGSVAEHLRRHGVRPPPAPAVDRAGGL